MSDQIVRRTSPGRRWKSWSGELQDLQRLISLMEQLAAQRKSEIMNSSLSERDLERWSELKNLVKVTIVDHVDSTTGPAEDILDELDRRTVEVVRIATDFPGYGEELTVTLSKIERSPGLLLRDDGVDLAIMSSSPGWAKQCFAQISDEIDKSVPKWAFFRTGKGMLTLAILSFSVLAAVPILIEARHVHRGFSLWVFLTVFVAFFIISWSALFGPPLLRWLFPSFELYGEGGSSSGSRRIAAIVAFIATIFAGVLVNLIT